MMLPRLVVELYAHVWIPAVAHVADVVVIVAGMGYLADRRASARARKQHAQALAEFQRNNPMGQYKPNPPRPWGPTQ